MLERSGAGLGVKRMKHMAPCSKLGSSLNCRTQRSARAKPCREGMASKIREANSSLLR